MSLIMTKANDEHFEQIWPIFQEVVQAGDSYVYDPDTTYQQFLTGFVDRQPKKINHFWKELNTLML